MSDLGEEFAKICIQWSGKKQTAVCDSIAWVFPTLENVKKTICV